MMCKKTQKAEDEATLMDPKKKRRYKNYVKKEKKFLQHLLKKSIDASKRI